MAKIPSNRVAWQYHADDGTIYRVAALEGYVTQVNAVPAPLLGGEAWNGTSPPKPARIKMRRITLSAAGVGSRVVPMYATGAPIAVAGTAFNVNFEDNSVAMTSSGNPIPQGHLRESVTKQST